MATTDATPALRVLIGEDDVFLREDIARILSDAGLCVVAQAGDADELVSQTLACRPDAAIVDVQRPPRREDDGLRAAVRLRRRLPEFGVLMAAAPGNTEHRRVQAVLMSLREQRSGP
jgi:DNA-binding NarL/FixJ family response regulator